MTEPGDQSEAPQIRRAWLLPPRLLRGALTPRRAALTIVWATVLVTLAGGVAVRLVDHREFTTLGDSFWWALQTVTSVGYGDIVPEQTGGRIIGALLMLQGIALITVVAAAVTAALIEQARKRRTGAGKADQAEQLTRIEKRLAALETALPRGRE